MKEKIQNYTWAAAALAFLGVAIIVNDGLHSGRIFGDILAFVSACCTAASFTIMRYSRKNVATSIALGSLFAALVASAFFTINIATVMQPAGFGILAIVWLGLNGLVAIPIATTLMANGPRYLPAVDVSMFFMLETVLTPIWIWLIFGTTPTTAALWGGLLIIATLVAHSYLRMRSAKLPS